MVSPNVVCYAQECVTASFARAFAESTELARFRSWIFDTVLRFDRSIRESAHPAATNCVLGARSGAGSPLSLSNVLLPLVFAVLASALLVVRGRGLGAVRVR